ncbi:MAG TPA: HAMP domain-containing sensor histidine kinase [Acidimicrobiales bacterium]|nr:HAMP domain-containing sensor histidine kinase [Acidimicrobiales bacterium]
MARRGSLGPLGARLVLAFVAVAVGALALLSLLVLLAAQGDVSHLVGDQQKATLAGVAQTASAAYTKAGGWSSADLATVVALAEQEGAWAVIADTDGRQLATSPAAARPSSGVTRSQPIVAANEVVGRVSLRFAGSGLPSPERRLRDTLVRTVAAGAGLAALLALGVAVAVSRRITRPVVALTAAARAMEQGESKMSVVDRRAPGELGELAVAFDHMAQAVARQDSLRRAMVADVAHELRTPLAVLQGYFEAIAEGVVEPSPAQLASLHDEVLRLGRTVEDLETLAAAEAAGLRMSHEKVDLAEVADKAAALLAPRFDSAGIRLDIDLSSAVVHGDAHRLHQVVTNLLTNALKFTPAGGQVRVEVSSEPAVARLQVADTGMGIPAEELSHVFERFWRGGQVANSAGSGIGLTVVAELVRAHQGRIEAVSQPGRGTRFTVTLPLA